MKKVIAGILCVTMMLGGLGCGIGTDPQIQSQNLMLGLEENRDEVGGNGVIPDNPSDGDQMDDLYAEIAATHPITTFGLNLFQNAASDENVLLSPLSVLLAMYMTANGAAGDTKIQMADVLGKDLNAYLQAYQTGLPQGDGYKLHIANGIWFRDVETLEVKKEFLELNQKFFNAGIYKAPFNDITCREINNWVKENTDGMIDGVLDEIDASAVLYLINALSFDAKWQTPYNKNNVFDNAVFVKEDGTQQKVTMMYSEESTYLEDERATGFVKYYQGKKYAFVALLPKEGITVSEYVAGLDTQSFHAMLNNAKNTVVNTGLPKFKTEYSILLNDVLQQMGMTKAFDSSEADLSAMATSEDGNLYINRVLHKTFISVDELGTKAGAVTAVEVNCERAVMESYSVILDRPFVYMLIDCETNQPFFIGTMMDVEK